MNTFLFLTLIFLAASLFVTFYPAVFLFHFYFGTRFVDKYEEKITRATHQNLVDKVFTQISDFLQFVYLLLHPKGSISHPELPVLTVDSLEDFRKVSKRLTMPVLIRAGLKDSSACKLWDFDYFEKKYANKSVACIDDSSVENSNVSVKQGTLLEGSVKTLGSVIQNIRAGGKNYISNVSEFLKENPELVEDLEIKGLISGIKKKSKFSEFNYLFSQIFMGNSNSVSALHCAIGTNLFINVYGQKEWVLLSPKYTSLLKPHLNEFGLFAFSEQDIFNPNDISQRIPHYRVTLEPGDVLFIPPWWWHAVRNVSDLTIGIANRVNIEDWAYLLSNRLFTYLHFKHGLGWARETPDKDILNTYVSVKPSEEELVRND
ncbi:MAG: cupin-like domain-containing protein [Thermosynechococcaceae cyanobacterium MS004]|nr:cupin-like domain-containing protein [Thermosynechococcaceae cyanobacterium MS004]